MARKPERKIKLSKEQTNASTQRLQQYLYENFDLDLSGLQAEMLLDFITESIGPCYYNAAVGDAIAFMAEKADDMYLLMHDEPER